MVSGVMQSLRRARQGMLRIEERSDAATDTKAQETIYERT